MQRQGHGTVIDLTGSDWTHASEEFPLPYDQEVDNSESNPYADAGGYEYTYAGTDAMSAGIPKVQSGSRVGVLCYKVLSSGVKPYIMFGLCYGTDGLGLMDAKMPGLGGFCDGVTDIGKGFGIRETVYRGYLRNGADTILCIEDAAPEQKAHAPGSSDFQWVLSTEIMNHSRALGTAVDPRVVEFFEAHPSLLFLHDELGHLHESPEVGYCGTSRRRAASLAVLGAPRDGPTSDMGPYYRFLDYEGGVRQAEEQVGDGPKALTRFALFLGRTAMSAPPGEWSGYDSLRAPGGTICVREYNQQIPLSSHPLPHPHEV
tara:strand:+ start:9406 stop:10353 length:948 start_codon:yes stop_codon:yes gene_type:complete